MWGLGRSVVLAFAVAIITGTAAMEIDRSENDLLRPDRIVGGNEVVPGTFNWQVSLQKKTSLGYHHFCGGALVAEKWVVTAAHCVRAVSKGDVRVATGPDLRNPAATYSVVKWLYHPDYSTVTMENDIGLAKISTNKRSSSKYARGGFESVPIPLSNEREDVYRSFYISGFGHTSYGGQPSTTLLFAEVQGVSDEECQANISRLSSYQVFNTNLCAGGGNRDACQGDSGGPIVKCTVDKPLTSTYCKLVGVTSWGIKCATPGAPGIYTETGYFSDWINEHVGV